MRPHNNVWGIAERSLNQPRLRASALSLLFESSTMIAGTVVVVTVGAVDVSGTTIVGASEVTISVDGTVVVSTISSAYMAAGEAAMAL